MSGHKPSQKFSGARGITRVSDTEIERTLQASNQTLVQEKATKYRDRAIKTTFDFWQVQAHSR